MITEGGIIGKIGCNDAGVGVCLNALLTKTWEAKIPIHLGLRAILDSSSFDEALAAVNGNQMASPAHFLIASKEEKLMCVEVSPVLTGQIGPENGVLFHTNHLCNESMQQAIYETPLADSLPRLKTIESLLYSVGNNSTAADLFSILANHEHYPNSICRHQDVEKLPHERMETVFSVVMDLTHNKLSYLLGNPCVRERVSIN